MTHPNLDLIDRFFEAYSRRDFTAIQQLLAGNVVWTFPGRNPVSGTRRGVGEIIAFFDDMGRIMGDSNASADKLVTGVNEEYVVECQHIRTHRDDGIDLDHQWCVLWRFENGQIAEGRHFAADQDAVDTFFVHVTG